MLFVTIVMDGVGIGEAPDAHLYGDVGEDTLGHICQSQSPNLPNLQKLGLGNIADLHNLPAVSNPIADYGKMEEVSAGKDSTTGHWELAGITLDKPFPTYPNGFPQAVVAAFCRKIGVDKVLANCVASGTAVIEQFGEAHAQSGYPILYTSADSVFQIAADTDVVPLETLYHWCEIARNEICIGEHAVGRVIARPYHAVEGKWVRRSDKRKDYALLPPQETLQETLQKNDVHTTSVGKIADLFAGVGFDEQHKTANNTAGMAKTLELVQQFATSGIEKQFIWVNLVDFDQDFGHRLDPVGFAKALEAFDAFLPELLDALPAKSRLFITADHGNDPCGVSTDHAREYVPVLDYHAASHSGKNMGTLRNFTFHRDTVLAYFALT